MDEVARQTIERADLAIARADAAVAIANTFMVGAGLALTAITIFLTIGVFFLGLYFNREKKKDIDKAISEVLQEISKNSTIREELIQNILSRNEFRQELKAIIDIAARDQIELNKEGSPEEIGELESMKG